MSTPQRYPENTFRRKDGKIFCNDLAERDLHNRYSAAQNNRPEGGFGFAVDDPGREDWPDESVQWGLGCYRSDYQRWRQTKPDSKGYGRFHAECNGCGSYQDPAGDCNAVEVKDSTALRAGYHSRIPDNISGSAGRGSELGPWGH